MSIKSAFEEIAREFWYTVDTDDLPTTDKDIQEWVLENITDEIVDTINELRPATRNNK